MLRIIQNLIILLALGCYPWMGYSQAEFSSWSSSEIQHRLEKLQVLGSVLYFAAHPDDENTALIAWLAQEQKYKTAYLSLTRGDGGQNLIGKEIGVDLGLIRTHELLAARARDQGEQYFSSALDFGFSKTPEETFEFWEKEEVLKEAVGLIRKIKPDVIITRFPPDSRGGHGHHQASAMLAREAFDVAQDPAAYPEQVEKWGTWKPKRLLWNTYNFGRGDYTSPDQIQVDISQYNSLLGHNYAEAAAISRTQHKSQGFGDAPRRGQYTEYFELIAGEDTDEGLFKGVDTSWERVENGKAIKQLLSEIIQKFDPNRPQASLPLLLSLKSEMSQLEDSFWVDQKLHDLDEVILACSGLYMDFRSDKDQYVQGAQVVGELVLEARKHDVEVELVSINQQDQNKRITANQPISVKHNLKASHISHPFWLERPFHKGRFDVETEKSWMAYNNDVPLADVRLRIQGVDLNYKLPLQYYSVSPVYGEVREAVSIVPEITASVHEDMVLFSKTELEKAISITFEKHSSENMQAAIKVNLGKDWEVKPREIALDFKDGETKLTKEIVIKASNINKSSSVLTLINSDGNTIKQVKRLNYSHIPKLTSQPDLEIQLIPVDIETPKKNILYVNGSGDLIPSSLRLLGYEIDEVQGDDLSAELLADYDVLIFGVRALNVDPSLASHAKTINQFAENGGVVLMQYHVANVDPSVIAPYPFEINATRVTQEDSEVFIKDQTDPVFNFPNAITADDFNGWVQERGLYFVSSAGNNYRMPLEMADTNEELSSGSLIVADVGQGRFVYTSISFFRQLPAGVPGAFKLFVNLFSLDN